MSELGETFKFMGRVLKTVPSPEGCSGCYLDRSDDMSCQYHEPETDACSKEQRGDENDVRYMLDGPHLKITFSLKGEDFRNCTIGSVHQVRRIDKDGYLIEGAKGDFVKVSKSCAQLFRVKMKTEHMAGGVLLKKGAKYPYLSGSALVVEILLEDDSTICVPTEKIEFYD